MQITANDIAHLLGGDLEGDGTVLVDRPGKIEEGGEGVLTFLGNPKYEPFAYSVKSSVLLANKRFVPNAPVAATALIRVDDVYDAVRLLLEKFGRREHANGQVSEQAFVHASARLGRDVSIGTFSVLEEEVVIGEGSVIYPQVFLGKNVEIGKGCIVFFIIIILHYSSFIVMQP